MPELADLFNTSLLPAASALDADDIAVLSQDGTLVRATTTQVVAVGASYTNENAQDAVGTMVNTTLIYNDATPSLGRAALTGDVTAAAGSNATTIANNAVTTAKIIDDAVTNVKLADVATNRIKGRVTAATGDVEDLTPAQTRTVIASDSGGGTTNFLRADGTWAAPAGGSSYTNEEAQDAVGAMVDTTLVYNDTTPSLVRAALTGDVTAAAGSNATTIANNAVTTAKIINSAVTNAKLADVATNRFKGRVTAATGAVEDLTPADARTVLASDSGGGTTNFLRADGTWAAPAGSTADEEAYVYLTNTAGHYISAPDAAAFDITGDLCIVARIGLEDWTPAATSTVVSKRVTGSLSYHFLVHTNQRLRLIISSDGTTLTTFDATANIPSVTVGVGKWIAVVFTADDGASGKRARFYHSSDGVSWTQIGADVTQATVWPGTFVGTQPLEIGSYDSGTANSMVGKVFEVSVRSGTGASGTVGGTEVAHFVADEMASARMRDSLGVLWTLYGDAAGVSGGGGSLDGLSDVIISSASGGEVIRHNGTNWVDATLTAADVSFSPTGSIAATTVQAAIAEVASEASGGSADPLGADFIISGRMFGR